MPTQPDQGPEQLSLFNPSATADIVMEAELRGVARAVHAVLVRQITPATQDARVAQEIERGIVAARVDPVLGTLTKVVGSITTGGPITEETRDQVTKLVTNQEERADLIRNLLLTHQYDRLIRFVDVRDHLERVMLACAKRGDLTPAEALAFMKIAIDETESITSDVKAGATTVNDIMGMLNKVDFAVQIGEKDLARKFSNTTPQGREIVRRLAKRLGKMAGGKPGKPAKSVMKD